MKKESEWRQGRGIRLGGLGQAPESRGAMVRPELVYIWEPCGTCGRYRTPVLCGRKCGGSCLPGLCPLFSQLPLHGLSPFVTLVMFGGWGRTTLKGHMC